MENEFKITFLPDNKAVYAMEGTSVMEAAGRAGVVITAPCGGAGTCGKCRVIICSGRTNPPGPAENSLLSKKELKAGVRLACQALITGECLIEIPAGSKVAAYNILVSGRLKKIPVNSGVSKKTLQTGKARGKDSRSRIEMILKKTGCREARIEVIRKIAELDGAPTGEITAVCRDGKVVAIENGDTRKQCYGIAFDLGTTTLAATLLDIETGRELATASRLNPQVDFGDDLISRIKHAGESSQNLDNISNTVIFAFNSMISELASGAGVAKENIYKITVSGNTGMQHLFLKVNPASLGELPFSPVVREPLILEAGQAGLNVGGHCSLYVFPAIGGFVGGDTVSAILASGITKSSKIRMLIDIGTNGEIVIGSKNRLLCASAAAGPAFESARISQGMIASSGAIEKVIINTDVHINVIGNTSPRGICGSGLVDAAAQMLKAGLLDASGKILSREELRGKVPGRLLERIVERGGMRCFTLSGSRDPALICVSQRDIRELQLAKAAIFSGIEILRRKLGIKLSAIEEVLIAGAFGNYIRRSSAKRIGLIPPLPSSKIKFIGNGSSSGAKLALLSKDIEAEAEKISKFARHIELASSGAFQTTFADSMFFPAENDI